MFKKNSIEFFVRLQPYLYYYYSGCTLESHNHMSFPKCSMTTWPCHMIWLTKSPLFISLLHCMLWGFELSVQIHGKPFPVWGSYNNWQLVVMDSCFLLSTGLHAYSPAPFITFYPFWPQNRLEMSVVTLMVRRILYAADPLQMPALPPALPLTIHIFFPFLVQISPLTQLHNPRPFVLAFTLTLPFQIPSFISKIFLALVPSQLSHLVFLPFSLASFLCFSLFPGFFHTGVDASSFSPPPSPSQFQGCVLPAMASLRSPLSSPGHIYSSLLILHAPCNTSCILFHTLPFLHYCLFHLCFWSRLASPISPS